MLGRMWWRMSDVSLWLRGLAAQIQARALGQMPHQILVELVLGLARFLFGNRRTFVFFDRHANIVADGQGSNLEDWLPLWIVPAKVFEREWAIRAIQFGRACGNDRDPQGPRPAIFFAGLGRAAYAAG